MVGSVNTGLDGGEGDSMVELWRLADQVGGGGEILVHVLLCGGVDDVGREDVVLWPGYAE